VSRPNNSGGARSSQRGQGLVEFAIVMPVFLLLLTGMLEFGLAFSDRLTMGNATREGARIGGALATGNSAPCSGDPAGVDKTIIASLQNILKSGGSDVDLSRINSIRIFKATTSGAQVGGNVNVWTYTPGAGPDADPGTGTEILDFSPSSTGWPACTRSNGAASPDSIGVSIDYQYQLKTPLAGVIGLLGGSQGSTLHIVDTTVMALNPTS
jgi:Flp pilus assembly protein TadG